MGERVGTPAFLELLVTSSRVCRLSARTRPGSCHVIHERVLAIVGHRAPPERRLDVAISVPPGQPDRRSTATSVRPVLQR
jgi:hypothetical protein